MTKMNILFINKPFFIEPLGIMYLMSALKKAGHNVQLAQPETSDRYDHLKYQPDIVCCSIMTGDQDYYNKAVAEWKKLDPKILSVAGGPHPTFFPEMIDDPDCAFDCICIGEGEGAIVDLANGRSPEKTANIWTKTKKNTVRPLIQDLDAMPDPDREEVFKLPIINDGPIKHFIAGRGCPYDCSYCFNKAYSDIYPTEKRVRLRDPLSIISEIVSVMNRSPTKVVYFQDDTFIINKEWLARFAHQYKHHLGTPYHCHCRANLVDATTVELLKKSGCISVHLAAETGNQEIRNKLLNRNMTDEQIINACELFRKAGIKVMLQNIIGLPGTTFEDDLETLRLNIKCNPDYAWVSIFQPYPKTELGEYAKSTGEYKGDFSDIGNNFFDGSPLEMPEWRKRRTQNLQKLFAWAVQNPVVLESGLLIWLLDNTNEAQQECYKHIYKNVRKASDRVLYGVDL